MPQSRPQRLNRILVLLAGVLVLKVTLAIVTNYRYYWPPDFNSDFLRGREEHFFGSYQWAFHTHLVSGPPALVLGLLLLSSRFRMSFLAWHRTLGRIQALNVLFLLVPSGLWMSFYAAAGPVAAVAFFLLSILTGATVALGWRAAVNRRFLAHERWMQRCFILLCSAVILRVVMGLVLVLEIDFVGLESIAAWACWVGPLLIYELITRWRPFPV